jgi:hypothetical protein
MIGEWMEQAPPILIRMIYSCSARAWKPKLQWRLKSRYFLRARQSGMRRDCS